MIALISTRMQACLLTLIVFFLPVTTFAQDTIAGLLQQKVATMADSGTLHIRGHRILAEDIVGKFYENRNFEPAWTNPAQIQELMDLVGNAWQHGARIRLHLCHFPG